MCTSLQILPAVPCRYRSLFASLVLLVLSSPFTQLCAQRPHPGAAPEPASTYRWQAPPPSAAKTADGPPDTLSLPFFENFRRGDFRPDSTHWFRYDSVNRVRNGLPGLPDGWAAILDGSDDFERPYDNISLSGRGDFLESHCIDLSNFTEADSLYLSFRYQAGGLYEAPDEADSLQVQFLPAPIPPDTADPNDTLPTSRNFETVWSIDPANVSGGLPTDRFLKAQVPLRDSISPFLTEIDPFHKCFRFRIVRTGNLGGRFDVWAVDYIRLDNGRFLGDTLFNDVGLTAITGSPFDSLRGVPRRHLAASGASNLGGIGVQVRNFSGQFKSLNVELQLESVDANGQAQVLASQTAPLNLGGEAAGVTNFNGFALPSTATEQVLRLRAFLAGNVDGALINDTLTADFPMLGERFRDDAEAETNFGLNNGRDLGFGQLFHRPQPDSLRALWLSFYPDERAGELTSYRAAVWEDLRKPPFNSLPPDSGLIADVFKTIKYFDPDNGQAYQRIELPSPVPVPPSFFAGIIQESEDNVALGMDLDHPNQDRIYWDDDGNWRQSNAQGANGSLLIRAEFTSGRIFTGTEPLARTESAYRLTLFPNPVRDGRVNLQFQGVPQAAGKLQWQLLDLQGRRLHTGSRSVSDLRQAIGVALPAELSAGRYLLRADLQIPGRAPLAFIQPLLVN